MPYLPRLAVPYRTSGLAAQHLTLPCLASPCRSSDLALHCHDSRERTPPNPARPGQALPHIAVQRLASDLASPCNTAPDQASPRLDRPLSIPYPNGPCLAKPSPTLP